jgi:hypothetical protein
MSDCQLQSRSRGPDFKSPSRESHLTIYRALNQGKQAPNMLAQLNKASESMLEAASFDSQFLCAPEEIPALAPVELPQNVAILKFWFRRE